MAKRTGKARNSAVAEAVQPAAQDNGGKDRRKALVERALVEKACILFAEKGYAGTSLTDIAEAVGLTRGAIYYYFKNKEALLESIVEEVAVVPLAAIAVWRSRASGTVAEQLRDFVAERVRNVLSNQTQMRMIEVTEAALPPDLLQRHSEAKRKILREYRSLIREGVLNGEFRPVDDRIAALGMIGIVNWTAHWYRPDRGATIDEVANQLGEMAMRSVLGEVDRKERFSTARTAIASLREDLDHLEKLVEGDA